MDSNSKDLKNGGKIQEMIQSICTNMCKTPSKALGISEFMEFQKKTVGIQERMLQLQEENIKIQKEMVEAQKEATEVNKQMVEEQKKVAKMQGKMR